MAMLSASAPRIFSIAGRREMIAAAVGAIVVILALANGHRSSSEPAAPVDQGWAGHLTAAAAVAAVPAEPMSSSSLVVPKSALILPPLAVKPIGHIKASCDSADRLCVVRSVAATAIPTKRPVVASAERQDAFLPPALIPAHDNASPPSKAAKPDDKGFSLNPLKHVPDISALGRPFEAAGQTVSGWIKWL